MKNLRLMILLAGVAMIGLAGCQPNDPELTTAPKAVPAVPPEKPFQVFDKHFDFAKSESTVQQAKYDENTVTAFFTMKKTNEQSVNDLKAGDLRVTENGISVTQFALSAERSHVEQIADIVFLVDITKSMTSLIESAKQRLKAFVDTSRAQHYHVRICIQTFGDYTVDKCDQFYDNTSDAQVSALKTRLAMLHSYQGKDDPGYPDLDENPMGSLIKAANEAPWTQVQGSQRFVILVTDWGFLYRANNPGDKDNSGLPSLLERNNPPRMAEVTKAIKDSGVKVFTVTRTSHQYQGKTLVWDGYNTPFQGEPGIVQSSGGEYFDFDKVLNGQITIDTILQRVLNRIDTTYKLSYVVDKNPGLDPTLPQAKRTVTVAPANAAMGVVKQDPIQSSMPTGRPQYQQAWKLSDNAIQPDSLQVFVEGQPLSRNDFTVSNGEVRLAQIPKAGAQIKFSYLFTQIEKNFRIEPMGFRGTINTQNTKVYLNGKEARPEDTIFEKDLEGNSSLRLAESALATNDPYDIRKNQGLTIRVIAK